MRLLTQESHRLHKKAATRSIKSPNVGKAIAYRVQSNKVFRTSQTEETRQILVYHTRSSAGSCPRYSQVRKIPRCTHLKPSKLEFVCSKVANKANAMLSFLQRNINKSPETTKELAYKSMVRPILEISSTVWDPTPKKMQIN